MYYQTHLTLKNKHSSLKRTTRKLVNSTKTVYKWIFHSKSIKTWPSTKWWWFRWSWREIGENFPHINSHMYVLPLNVLSVHKLPKGCRAWFKCSPISNGVFLQCNTNKEKRWPNRCLCSSTSETNKFYRTTHVLFTYTEQCHNVAGGYVGQFQHFPTFGTNC